MFSVIPTEAEFAVIGSLMQYGRDVYDKIADILYPEHFHYPILRDSYVAISEMCLTGDNVSYISVLAKFDEQPDLKQTLVECLDYSVGPAGVRNHAKTVVNAWKKRKALERLEELTECPLADVDDEISRVADELNGIVAHGDTEAVAGWGPSLDEAVENMFSPPSEKRIHLGFPLCDRIIGGIDPTDFVIIAARPSVGKSAFAGQVAIHLATKGKRILYISLEMPKQQIIERMAASIGGVELDLIRTRKIAEGPEYDIEKEKIEGAAHLMKHWSISVHDRGGTTPNQIMRLLRTGRYDVAIIDHIGLMNPGIKTQNREQEMSHISRSLRQIAMMTGTQIIALSQLNRKDAKGKVEISNLRDSGSLEQDAVMVIGLTKTTSGQVLFEVLKNRNGKCGEVLFNFDGSKMTFKETTDRYEEPPPYAGMGRDYGRD